MTVQTLKQHIPDYAKDIKLNLINLLSGNPVAGLTQQQVELIALACAYAIQNSTLINELEKEINDNIQAVEINAAKSAASIMSMNNIYYRFVHLVEDKEYSRMPANLRMNIIANPGIAKVDFELMSLAISAINGCGLCMNAHVNEVNKQGVSKQGIQSSIRIAAVLSAVAQSISIG